MAMNGIDISSYQGSMDLDAVFAETDPALRTDFVWVKVTQGTSYINDSDHNQNGSDWHEKADAVLRNNRLLGFYHYAGGCDPVAEANFFADQIEDYIDKGVNIALDWESGQNSAFYTHDEWTSRWRDAILERFGQEPYLYTNPSLFQYNPSYTLKWAAQYDNDEPSYYQETPWNEGAYDCHIRQYKGDGGRVVGYDGPVDLNKAYFSKEGWIKTTKTKKTKLIVDPRLKVFCDRMRYWCDEANLGYDQWQRWNIYDGGESDCSSLVYFCLWEAGFLTEQPTWGNTETLTNTLTGIGWSCVDNDGNPEEGDILLNVTHHVAVWLGDCLAQSSIDENGNIAGGESGDQTGWETHTRSYYNYPWDYYLRAPLVEVDDDYEEDDMVDIGLYLAYQDMVEHYYQTILGRHSDRGGLRAQTDACYDLSKNEDTKPDALLKTAYSLIGSDEWRNMEDQSGEFRIKSFYNAFLGRDPEDGAIQRWLDACNGDLYVAIDGVYNSEEAKQYRINNGVW